MIFKLGNLSRARNADEPNGTAQMIEDDENRHYSELITLTVTPHEHIFSVLFIMPLSIKNIDLMVPYLLNGILWQGKGRFGRAQCNAAL